MAKNYATIYAMGSDSISLEQRFYLKQELTRGTFIAPASTDFFFHLPGGQITGEQPIESSTQRSGRHHTSAIKKKITTSFSFSTYIHVDTTVAAGATEADPAIKTLWKSLLGKETVSGGITYDPSVPPDITFTLMEVGDQWARQAIGCFVQGGNVQLPGDGEATIEWSGSGKNFKVVGIGKSIVENAANDVTLQTGEGKRFPVGSYVMIIKADGTTRSADTVAGSARKVTAVNGDVVTLDGAVLTDADGSTTPIYLVYYEPDAPDAINDPQTGLVGSLTLSALPGKCFRSLGVNIQNGHELKDYCYGEEGLGGNLFVQGARLTVEVSLSVNLDHDLVEFYNAVRQFVKQDVAAIVGDASTRHFKVELPAVQFNVPGFSVPENGSIPVEFSGTAYQTASDAADEIAVKYL